VSRIAIDSVHKCDLTETSYSFYSIEQNVKQSRFMRCSRQKYGLSLRANPDGSPVRFDVLRPQQLATPVTVYINEVSHVEANLSAKAA
jgi:hypothetical protein